MNYGLGRTGGANTSYYKVTLGGLAQGGRGNASQSYYKYELKNVLISSYSVGGSG